MTPEALATTRSGGRRFEVAGADLSALQPDPYRAALDFVKGRFQVEGDPLAAIRAFTAGATPTAHSWLRDCWSV